METHLEHEMKSCLEEMEKLQTKAKELQQKKNRTRNHTTKQNI